MKTINVITKVSVYPKDAEYVTFEVPATGTILKAHSEMQAFNTKYNSEREGGKFNPIVLSPSAKYSKNAKAFIRISRNLYDSRLGKKLGLSYDKFMSLSFEEVEVELIFAIIEPGDAYVGFIKGEYTEYHCKLIDIIIVDYDRARLFEMLKVEAEFGNKLESSLKSNTLSSVNSLLKVAKAAVPIETEVEPEVEAEAEPEPNEEDVVLNDVLANEKSNSKKSSKR